MIVLLLIKLSINVTI